MKTGVSLYRLGVETPLRATNLSPIRNGTLRPTDRTLRILADYFQGHVTLAQLQGWRLIDEAPPEAIEAAFLELRKHKGG